jgi:hypothetical protein
MSHHFLAKPSAPGRHQSPKDSISSHIGPTDLGHTVPPDWRPDRQLPKLTSTIGHQPLQAGARLSATQADAYHRPSVFPDWRPAVSYTSRRLSLVSHTDWPGYLPFDAHSLGMPLYLTWGNYSQATTFTHSFLHSFTIIIIYHALSYSFTVSIGHT